MEDTHDWVTERYTKHPERLLHRVRAQISDDIDRRNEQIGCELFRLDLQDDGRAFDVLRMIKGGIPASIASFILVETLVHVRNPDGVVQHTVQPSQAILQPALSVQVTDGLSSDDSRWETMALCEFSRLVLERPFFNQDHPTKSR